MSILPSQYLEVENIYDMTFGNGLKSVSISAVNPGDGATTVAVALAQRNLLSGKSTLIVDMNSFNPSFQSIIGDPLPNLPNLKEETEALSAEWVIDEQGQLLESDQPDLEIENMPLNMSAPELISNNDSDFALTGVLAPNDTRSIVALRQPDILETQITAWFEEYDFIIFDTAPINRVNCHNIPAQRIIKACEGSIITTLSGSTTEAEIMTAMNKIKQHKQKVVGWVINDKESPNLKSELLRELQRLDPWLSIISRPLKRIIFNSKFLSSQI